MIKKCFKCSKEKPLNEFYKHSQMADGYLGKCKECTKKDTHQRSINPISREKIRLYEQKRFNNLERKKKIAEYQRNTRKNNNEKYKARTKVKVSIRNGSLTKLSCEICGNSKSEAHHEDYSKPLDVRWLCFSHHRMIHGQNTT